jgi:molecular chaperone DnaK (HSP70)
MSAVSMRLGIDFGTTRTVVAAALSGRYPVAVFETPLGYRNFVPSIASQGPRGIRFGWEAVRDPEAAPRAMIRSLKREVASRAPDDPLSDTPFAASALELTTEFLRFLRIELLENSNLDLDRDEPLEAMIAVPASAGSSQRYLTVEAFRCAGFRVLGLVNEPTAAAIEFFANNLAALGKKSPKRYVIVYDLGGGTFDTSAVSLLDRRFELIASEGIARLGGEDFDAVILEQALRQAGVREAALSSAERTCLLENCREAKESLSVNSRRLVVDLEPVLTGRTATLDMSDVNLACAPLVEQTLALLARIVERVREHGINPENPRELGGVYLVGGSTSFPLVARALRDHYKRKVLLAPLPHAATAVGLAVAADPDAGIYVREATTRHFGVWREREGGRAKVIDPIIEKGALPKDASDAVTRSYRPVHAEGQ